MCSVRSGSHDASFLIVRGVIVPRSGQLLRVSFRRLWGRGMRANVSLLPRALTVKFFLAYDVSDSSTSLAMPFHSRILLSGIIPRERNCLASIRANGILKYLLLVYLTITLTEQSAEFNG